jgi:hypothetical protein
VFELEVEVVGVVLLLPAGLVGVEVPLGVEVPAGLEVPLAEAPAPVFTMELALGSELPEHPFNRNIDDTRVTRAAHSKKMVRSAYFFLAGQYRR